MSDLYYKMKLAIMQLELERMKLKRDLCKTPHQDKSQKA